MTDDKMISTIESIEARPEEIETVLKQLNQAIDGYLQWMADSGYARSTREAYARDLKRFSGFVKQRKCPFDAIFIEDTLRLFKETGKSYQRCAVYGLSRFLFDQGKIPRPLTAKNPLTPIFALRRHAKQLPNLRKTHYQKYLSNLNML